MSHASLTWLLMGTLWGCSSAGGEETGQLTTQDPGEYTIPPISRDATSTSWSVEMLPSTDPIPLSESFDIDLVITDAMTGESLEGATVEVDANMPIHEHGDFVNTLTEEVGAGIYRASPLKLHMEGWWEIVVDITADEVTESVVFNVDCCE